MNATSNVDYLNEEYDLNPSKKGRNKEISPSGKWLRTKKLKKARLPQPVQQALERILKYYMSGLNPDDDDYAPGEIEYTYAQVDEGNPDVYQFGVHQSSPFNPSGYDFYVRVDGSYIGFQES